MQALYKKLHLLEIDYLVSGVSMVVLIFITCAGVVKRYFLNDPIVWLEEIQVWLFVWMAFFGGSAAFRSKSHVAIEVIVDLLPVRAQKVVRTLVYLISMVVLVYLLIQCGNLLQLFIATKKKTYVLDIPSSINMGGIVAGTALMILNYAIVIIKDFTAGKGGGEE